MARFLDTELLLLLLLHFTELNMNELLFILSASAAHGMMKILSRRGVGWLTDHKQDTTMTCECIEITKSAEWRDLQVDSIRDLVGVKSLSDLSHTRLKEIKGSFLNTLG